MPQILAGKNLWQNAFHEFDVYDHTLDYVKHLKTMTSDEEIVAAGYLHDIGKPAVAKLKYKNGKLLEKENGKPYHEFDDHEIVGEQIVRTMTPQFFNEYQLNQERIAKLVGNHFLPMDGIKAMRKTKNYEEFKEEYAKLEQTLDNSGSKREEVLMMFIADCLSKGKGCTDIEELKAIRESLLGNLNFSTETIYQLQKKMYGGKE
jgi:hypothetical protein